MSDKINGTQLQQLNGFAFGAQLTAGINLMRIRPADRVSSSLAMKTRAACTMSGVQRVRKTKDLDIALRGGNPTTGMRPTKVSIPFFKRNTKQVG